MKTTVKIDALRKLMAEQDIDAFIVYSADPHMSEYLPEDWQERSWLTGFTGSAGFVVITTDKAALWTDGRYFVQAANELENSGITLMKEGTEGTPKYTDWLKAEILQNGTVAMNALATPNKNWEEIKEKLSAKNIVLKDVALLDKVWTNRENSRKNNEIYLHPENRAGKSAAEKIAEIRTKLEEENASYLIISALDEVAWTLNLRGSDVEANPVFNGYLIISKLDALLFAGLEKLNVDARKSLDQAGVKMLPYEEFSAYLSKIKNETVWISPLGSRRIFSILEASNKLHRAASPVSLMKAVKNPVELAGFRTVMQRDGVAMVKFLYWLTHSVKDDAEDEFSVGRKLENFRAQGENFVGESFAPIIGYLGNGAIVHYSAKKNSAKKIRKEGSILVDSGGQYLEGTTDITRTLALGDVSEEFKKDATLVLQGMIRLSMVKFPKGTKGVHLDAIARLPLWMASKDYAHGTGHGVGSFMNVHEGPQNIRKDMNPQELLPGMVVSNEPGYYVENKYGIRHENLFAVKISEKTESGQFYEFETLTVCPFFKDIIVREMLSHDEIDWLNSYHEFCREKLENDLDGEVKEWFLELVKPM